jgi:hypothetical protein
MIANSGSATTDPSCQKIESNFLQQKASSSNDNNFFPQIGIQKIKTNDAII